MFQLSPNKSDRTGMWYSIMILKCIIERAKKWNLKATWQVYQCKVYKTLFGKWLTSPGIIPLSVIRVGKGSMDDERPRYTVQGLVLLNLLVLPEYSRCNQQCCKRRLNRAHSKWSSSFRTHIDHSSVYSVWTGCRKVQVCCFCFLPSLLSTGCQMGSPGFRNCHCWQKWRMPMQGQRKPKFWLGSLWNESFLFFLRFEWGIVLGVRRLLCLEWISGHILWDKVVLYIVIFQVFPTPMQIAENREKTNRSKILWGIFLVFFRNMTLFHQVTFIHKSWNTLIANDLTLVYPTTPPNNDFSSYIQG